jgi:hypothetical protein
MKKFAVIIGVEKYAEGSGISDLRFAARDAVVLSSELNGYGFRTVTLSDSAGMVPTGNAILNELEELNLSVEEDDLLFFFFAGHGMERDVQQSRRSFLLPQDAHMRRPNTWLDLATLQGCLHNFKCRRRIVVLDCCRNDPEAGRGDGDNCLGADVFSRDIVAAARPPDKITTSILMTACSPGQRSYEWGKKQHGVFTYYMLEALREHGWDNGELSMAEVCDYTQKKTCEWAAMCGCSQKPEYQQLGGAEKIILCARGEVPDEARIAVDIPPVAPVRRAVPGNVPAMPELKAEWFFVDAGDAEKRGPLTAEEMRSEMKRGRIDELTLVWRDGFQQWQPMERVAELMLEFASV